MKFLYTLTSLPFFTFQVQAALPGVCLNQYVVGCSATNTCCPGLECVVNVGSSQCLEPVQYRTSVNGCYISASAYGCTSSAQCCNPAANCIANFCVLPTSSVTNSPSSVPTSPSSLPTTFPTIAPTNFPSSPTLLPTPVPTIVTFTPTTKPTIVPTASTLSPSFKPTNPKPVKPSVCPSAAPTLKPSSAAPVSSAADSSSSPVSTLAIIGIIVAAVVVAVLVLIVCIYPHFKSKQNFNEEELSKKAMQKSLSHLDLKPSSGAESQSITGTNPNQVRRRISFNEKSEATV